MFKLFSMSLTLILKNCILGLLKYYVENLDMQSYLSLALLFAFCIYLGQCYCSKECIFLNSCSFCWGNVVWSISEETV